MRTLTSDQLAVLDDVLYQVGVRVLIADGDGTMRDYSSQAGYNWIDSIEIDVNIDQPVSQATINIRRDVIDGSGTVLSLSPLRSDSSLNRNGAGAFAPAIDISRPIQVFVATTAYGTAPISTDWQNLFEGKIDTLDIATNSIALTCRDLGGALVDRFILPDDNDIAPNYGSDTGTPIETVMQQILDDAMGVGVVTLYCPVSPGEMITPYSQQIQSVMDALQALADLIGYDIRYCWDEGTSAWRLTLQAIDRTKTTPDRTIPPSRYLQVSQLQMANTDIRNVVTVWYNDATTGLKTSVTVKNDDSIAQLGGPGVGERTLVADESSAGNPINTNAQATAFANNMLADLSIVLPDQIIVEHLDWSFELNDLQQYTANGIHYDTDQKWAVISYKHNISATQARTTVEVRGAPCGKYLGWLVRASLPANATVTPTLDNLRIMSEDDAGVTYAWTNGAGTSEVWAAYRTFASPVPDDPWSLVAAAVLPLDSSTFTIPKPPPGSFTYAQIEPRSAALVAGEIQRIVLTPGQPPIDFGASGQGTGSVDSNGNLSFNGDLPAQAISGKYLINTSRFPTDAEVLADGIVFNGRQFALTDVATVDFGESGYMTVIGFDGLNATGTPGPSMRLKASYTSFNGTKTIYLPAAAFTPTNTNQTFDTLATNDLTAISPTNYPNHPQPALAPLLNGAYFKAWPTLPDGVEITGVSMELYDISTGENPLSGFFGGVSYSLYRTAGNTYLGGSSATNGLGWQLISTTFSEETTGNSYYIWLVVTNTFTATTNFAFGGAYLTYDMPTPFQTV